MIYYTSTAVSTVLPLCRCLRQLTPITCARQAVTLHFRTLTYNAAVLHPLERRVRQVVSSGSLDIGLAHQMLDRLLTIDSPRPHISSFNILMGWAARAGHPEAALAMYAKMMTGTPEAAGGDGGGISPSAHTYGTLINCCCLAGNVDFALAFVPHILKRGIPLNNAICGALIGGLCDVGRLAEAVNLFRGVLLREEQRQQGGCYPDVVAYTALLDCAFRTERLRLGFSVLADMTKRGCEPNTITLNVIINGLCSAGRLTDAAKVFGGMMPDALTYTSLLDCCCRVGRTDLALALFGDMLRRSLRLDEAVATVIITGLCAEGRAANAVNMFLQMPEMGCHADVVTYNSLISCFGGMGLVEVSFAFFGSMMKTGHRPNLRTMNSLVNGLCVDERVAEAVSLIAKMAEMGLQPNVVTYNALVKGVCITGNVGLALKFLEGMIKCKSWPKPNVITYTTVIDELCRIGNMDDALRLFKDMENQGIRPNASTHRSIVRGYTCLGQWGEAIKYMEMMLSLDTETNHL